MLQIDRMDIDDVGGNPTKLATAVLKQLPDLTPPVPVRQIAEALGIYEIREEALDGLEGCLITPDDKSQGAILVHVDRPETRKRYTISHELGHYLNPWHKATAADGFRCTSRDMSAEKFRAGDRTVEIEVEANEFAAELLFPTALVNKFLRNRSGLEIEHILSMADRFKASREATARRYIQTSDEPAAIVFSKDGVVRYAKRHPNFPALGVRPQEALPVDTAANKTSLPTGRVSEWSTVAGEVWLSNPKGNRICEQTLAQQNGFRMTLLTLEESQGDEDEADIEWAAPTFHR